MLHKVVLLLLLVSGVGGDELLKLAFEAGDQDGDGKLGKDEFEPAIRWLKEARQQNIQAQMENEVFKTVPQPKTRIRGATKLEKEEQISAFSKAFVNSLGMIWATEIGDKTFFIAAVLAMRHSRCIVFSGALIALAVMTVLSAALGYALPSVLPRAYTHYASALLFLYFGIRLLRDAQSMHQGPSDELVEVEDELSADSPASNKKKENASSSNHKKRVLNTALHVFSQSFVLTFLAEWGDRSQIATIALAAAKDPVGVTLGGITGHAMCTGLAVLGGRMLASRISERTVAITGGVLFLLFATYAMFFESVPEEAHMDSSLALIQQSIAKRTTAASGSILKATPQQLASST